LPNLPKKAQPPHAAKRKAALLKKRSKTHTLFYQRQRTNPAEEKTTPILFSTAAADWLTAAADWFTAARAIEFNRHRLIYSRHRLIYSRHRLNDNRRRVSISRERLNSAATLYRKTPPNPQNPSPPKFRWVGYDTSCLCHKTSRLKNATQPKIHLRQPCKRLNPRFEKHPIDRQNRGQGGFAPLRLSLGHFSRKWLEWRRALFIM
jgi:hypothetical protein